ncbi:DUF1572 family protein [Mariniblastus fucicola]|uniref:DinB superfamily protein n=1 Tax=Mariniblastus fucicola TaxID=980251 RepID=A0A5B9PDF1_9BACT|nr:DUF1572 family protein [Mariniblastus fucicola]QEG24408.1 hypothetical protein MFFC18_43270 [Mariniblastus fucicola]
MNSENVSDEFCRLSIDLLEQAMIKIRHCLAQLDDEQIWSRPEPSLNSIGNLCLHIAGNLRQWGIVPFTDVSDQRDRGKEFADAPKTGASEILSDLENVVCESKAIWLTLEANVLLQRTTIQGFEVTKMQAISHTSSHFVGHTHQIIMLTRWLLGEAYRFQWTPESGSENVPL